LRLRYEQSDDRPNLEVAREYLKKEGERIRFLKSHGYTAIVPLPMSDLIDREDLQGFREHLSFIKETLPEMSMADMVYLYDEPNFRDVSTEMLERFVAAFKAEFPEPKVWICYAIVHPKYLDVVPPSNADILGIDPYMISEHCEPTAEGFEKFYQAMLACNLEWVNRWEKPFILAGDSFYSRNPDSKRMPEPETTLWYYQLALTQPKCIGLIWFYYGYDAIEDENLKGFNLTESSEKLIAVHRQIGEAILGEPSPLGLQWDTFGPVGSE
jgi:hypothetical protein